MRFGLISTWAAAVAVGLALLSATVPAGAVGSVVLPGGGGANSGGRVYSQPQPIAAPTNPYMLTIQSRAALVPIGQTQGRPFVSTRGRIHANFSSESVLYSFAGASGVNPVGDIQQLASPLRLVGAATLAGNSSGNGTEWLFTPGGLTFKVLHSHSGSDGANPVNTGGPARGGPVSIALPNGGAHGVGAVATVTPSGKYTILHSFNGADGMSPQGSPLSFVDGCLYGTTSAGGAYGFGTVWQICGVKFRTLHNFNENAPVGEGGEPTAGLSEAINGLTLSSNLYGVTQNGGPGGQGTIYSLNPSNGAVTTLFAFDGGSNGGIPLAELVPDFNGNLYGTANGGGTFGLGTVFKYALTSNILSVLFTFGSDDPLGAANPSAPLAFDASGNLYGTTPNGGQPNQGGVAFVLPASGGYIQLWSFGSGSDGVNPIAPVVVGADGSLYGTTVFGGAPFNGVIWRLQ